jgi:hypothetical protein
VAFSQESAGGLALEQESFDVLSDAWPAGLAVLSLSIVDASFWGQLELLGGGRASVTQLRGIRRKLTRGANRKVMATCGLTDTTQPFCCKVEFEFEFEF